jgi:hypothetical protein
MKGIDYNVYEETIKMNKNIRERDLLLKGFFDTPKYIGGTRTFKKLPLPLLKVLVSEGFADPNDQQNHAPSIGDLITFAEEMEKKGYSFYFSGYAVSDTRVDYRVSIDTILVKFYFNETNHINNKIIKAFFRNPDMSEEDHNLMLFWYD